ncbi:MAG: hypothetical protein MI923_00750 [Phycisphaerales bacterium]|nr:hypothetical protein [Phycisphaerales bacterium]
MAGKLVRCVCGTVFDPTKKRACPECGAEHEDKPTKAVEPQPKPETTLRREEPVRQDTTGGFGTDDISFLTKHKTAVVGAGGVVGLLLVALIMRSAFSASDSSDTTAGASRGGSRSSSSGSQQGLTGFQGKWRLLTARMQPEPIIPGIPITGSVIKMSLHAAFTGPDANTTLTIDKGGSYAFEIDVSCEGQYTATITPDRYDPTKRGRGVITLTPKGTAIQERADARLGAVETDMPHVNAKVGDTDMSMQDGTGNSNNTTVFWKRPGGSGQPHTSVVGTWSNELVFIDSYLPYRATLEFRDNGDYRLRFTRSESGMLDASDGKYQFKRSIAMGPPVEGRYEFDGPDRLTFTEPRGTATWVRAKD